MVRIITKISLSVFVILFLSGCATTYNPATGRKELIFISSETETAIGKNVQEELLKKQRLSNNFILQERIKRVGKRLVNVSERKDVEYNFYLLEDKELNAMALPGGFIYVNEGLAKILSDDELAYVIGHEVGHVAGRHIVKKLQANMTYQLILTIALAGSGNSLEGEAAVDVARGADTVYNLISLGYSRKDEYEADKFGARYSRSAGYNPYAALSALEKIKQEEGPDWKVLGYYRSHPYADDRIAALKKYISELDTQAKDSKLGYK